jgi:hypothetical protein
MHISLQLRTANALARRTAISTCHERRSDARMLADEGVRFFRSCIENGLGNAFLDDALGAFRDELSSLVGRIDKDLDNAGVCCDERVDLSEVDALLEKVRSALPVGGKVMT